MIKVRVFAIVYEAEGVHSFDLRPIDGSELPAFAAGAHIDVHLPNGLMRNYSLINPAGERYRYVVAVSRDPASRGGSRFMHESLSVGTRLEISEPRNNFPLVEILPHVVLIAGGIGITPIWSMVQRLETLGRSWQLHYCVRTRQQAAFIEPLKALGTRVQFNFDHEPGGKLLDIAALVAGVRPDAHLYCCGPMPMLTAFEEATRSRPAAQVHVEYFSPKELPVPTGGYVVELARTQRTFAVGAGESILATLIANGIDVPYSCEEGICGSCKTKVLSGTPDHRDMVLTEADQLSNQVMMICCSGCKGDKLILDL